MAMYETPKDVIPGYTTFLWSECRPRLEEETVWAWKSKDKSQNLREELDVGKLTTELDLLSEIKSLQQQLSSAETSIENRIELIEQDLDTANAAEVRLQKEVIQLTKEREGFLASSAKLQKSMDIAVKTGEQLADQTLKYGDHTENCNFIDLLQSGRAVGNKEKDLCSCGWSAIKQLSY